MKRGHPRTAESGHRHKPTGSLHLVDAENLSGDPFASRTEVLRSLARYGQVSGYAEGDLAFIAANRWLLGEVIFELPFSTRVHTASGPDGADRRLLAEAPPNWVCRRFRRLVIGSGDHIFADLAETALQAGLQVTVVAPVGSVAAVYLDLGCEVVNLEGRGIPPTPALVRSPKEAA